MTIDQAIKYLNKELANIRGLGMQIRIDAIKLGIEALKRVQNAREHAGYIGNSRLPGETENDKATISKV